MPALRSSTPSLWRSVVSSPSPATTQCSRFTAAVVSNYSQAFTEPEVKQKVLFLSSVTTVNRTPSSSPSSMASPQSTLPLSFTLLLASEPQRDLTAVFLSTLFCFINILKNHIYIVKLNIFIDNKFIWVFQKHPNFT